MHSQRVRPSVALAVVAVEAQCWSRNRVDRQSAPSLLSCLLSLCHALSVCVPKCDWVDVELIFS